MPTQPSDFLDVSPSTDHKPLHRSRSGGYTDFLAEKEKWERRDRERDMKKYHDSRYSSSTLSPIIPQERTSADRLYVPTFDNSHRRVRSYDQIVEKRGEESESRGYKVREERPRSYDGSRAGLSPARPAELPERPKRRGTKHRRPSIKVQIHQDDAPRTPSAVTPRRSPAASPSPRSPSGQPQLLFLSSMLQSRLAEIGQICHPNADIEAADPKDLTFLEIAEAVEGFAFQFKVWSQIVNLMNMERIDVTKRKNVELAARTLERILERVEELMVVCSRASPRDLRIEPLPDTDEDDGYGSYEDSDNEHDGSVSDVTESLGFIILAHLESIRLQMQTLSRMTRSLQEATPDAKDAVIAVGDLIAEVDGLFGSHDNLERYSTNPDLDGGEALNEARYAAGRNR